MEENRLYERRQSKRPSVIIDVAERVWTPRSSRRASDESKKSLSVFAKRNVSDGSINLAFVPDDLMHELQQVHIGHSQDVKRKSIAYLRKELDIDYHVEDIETLCNRFSTNVQTGLSLSQIKLNQEKFGRNAISPPKREPIWIKYLTTLIGGFQLLLWAAALLSFIAYIAQLFQTQNADPPAHNLYLAIALIVIVVILGLFTFQQEFSRGKVMESFAKLVPGSAKVIRDGKLQTINTEALVVGDIVEVKFGDKIPADLRILECQEFKIDNSSLTGESQPQSRCPECTNDNPMETRNLAFMSTKAVEGTAKGMVVAVGDHTFIGRIASLATGMDAINTPLSREMSHFVAVITGIAVLCGVTFFIVSLLIGYRFLDCCIFLVSVIIAIVPEGLLVTFAAVLSLTAKGMVKKNCLVRQLHAVETLGSCSVICSDKTGTLTQNKMVASHTWYASKMRNAEIEPKEDYLKDPGFISFARVATLCNRARFFVNQGKIPLPQRKIVGDASDCAILQGMEKYLENVEQYQEKNPKIFSIPFNSSRKWELSIHESNDPDDRRYILAMKGAPEQIMDMCSKIRVGNEVHDFDENWKAICNGVYEELGSTGERLLGFSEKLLPTEEYPEGYLFDESDLSFLHNDLTFVGLISLIDPIRPEVASAVERCRSAGIKVVMVTGDHPITATAVARQIGIISPGSLIKQEEAKRLNVDVEDIGDAACSAIVVTGLELSEMGTEDLENVLRNYPEIVFARVSPQQKLVIVEGFQRLGKTVAVTGDGVNDAPALKKADIGIAMGLSGSNVAKQAASMVLLDDNFNSIVSCVEGGRLIFENLRKCIRYLLCANTANLVPFLAYFILQVPLPLGTVQMLVVCLATDILPTISLSYEKPEGDIMKRAPRNTGTDKLVTKQLLSYAYGVIGMIEACAGLFTYLVVMGQNGFLPTMLIGIQTRWYSKVVNDLEDSYGQEWTYYQRKDLERTCWTAYFCTIVICQWANLLVSKVRRECVLKKLFDNWVIYLAIIIETSIACFLIYTPGVNSTMSYMPIGFTYWLTGLPFALLIIIFDEIRRFILRSRPNWDWYQKELFY